MLPHVEIEGGFISKIPVTGGAVIGGLFHVLCPQVSFESAGIAELQFADRALLVISFHSLHNVTNLLCLLFPSWVFPQAEAVVHNEVVHGKRLLQINGRGRLWDRISCSGRLWHLGKWLVWPLPLWVVPFPVFSEVNHWIFSLQGPVVTWL